MNKQRIEELVSSFFLILPIVYIMLSFLVFTFPLHPLIQGTLFIPLYSGLVLLATGTCYSERTIGARLRMMGWILFAFYWSTQPLSLYYSEQEDLINALICIIGIFILFYFAYREWWSIQSHQKEKSLQWIAGATARAM